MYYGVTNFSIFRLKIKWNKNRIEEHYYFDYNIYIII